MLNALESDNWEVRRNALAALGKSGQKTVIPYICPFLFDRYEEVRKAASSALEKLGVTREAKIGVLSPASQQ